MWMLFLLGCSHTIMQTVVLSPEHYLLLDDQGEAFDCKSYPNNVNWRPRCVRLNYDRNPPKDGVAPGEEAPASDEESED